MVLSDRTIKEEIEKGRIVIRPFDPSCIQPASVDVHLHHQVRVFEGRSYTLPIDPRKAVDDRTQLREISEDRPFELQPEEFVLGSTLEYIALPPDIVGRLEGKSSLGRMGLLLHSTAGYVDPGWKGQLTLELSNVSKVGILLFYRMPIGQISFLKLTTAADRPYGTEGLGSKYLGQMGPTPSRYCHEFDRDLVATKGTAAVRRKRGGAADNATLREWLEQSRFGGSVRLFAEALGVSLKTAEDWFYRGARPEPGNRARIFDLTQLPQYEPPPLLLRDS